MKKKMLPLFGLLVAAGLMSFMPGLAQQTVKIQFDSNKEVSGQKFALKDITPGLPSDWNGYNFVVLEYKISTPQRFHVGFTTKGGYNELRVMSYTPNGWNKLAIPLKFYRALPDAANDLAATYNQPRYTGWVNLGGNRTPLVGVDSIGIRMNAPINNPTLELRSVYLSVEDPGDVYMEDQPMFNEFGQWNLGEYEGKIKSEDQLRQQWAAEDKEQVSTKPYNYSKYGGYLHKKVKAAGFFRTEKVDGRWWFVDPEGYLFLSVGVDCVAPGNGGNALNIDKRRNLYKELPPEGKGFDAQTPNTANFGVWNLYRRYGDDYPQKSREMIIKRMDKWGLNTIANWSSPEVTRLNKKAYMFQMGGLGTEGALMGLADVYAPEFNAKLDAAIKKIVEPNRENPWLIGYFVANEPAWLEQETRLCQMILDGKDRPIKSKLTNYLAGNDTPERRKQFLYETFRLFLEAVNKTVKQYDPNHLNLGMRFGHVPPKEVQNICKDYFDVFSFNCYDLYPRKEFMDQILDGIGLPMIIGEYHFGTVDRGMAQSLWQVNTQQEGGVAYRY